MTLRGLGMFVALSVAGCNGDVALVADGGVKPDFVIDWDDDHDLAPSPMLNECGDTNPTCTSFTIGPPFSLEIDPKPDPGAKSVGLRRDVNGWLGLDQTHAGRQATIVEG
mgnify:CR=1 FL=1